MDIIKAFRDLATVGVCGLSYVRHTWYVSNAVAEHVLEKIS